MARLATDTGPNAYAPTPELDRRIARQVSAVCCRLPTVDPKPDGRTQFEKLEVYRLSEKLADEIWATVTSRDRFAKQTVGAQVVRSADSIGANIAEGAGRGSFQDNRRFVRTARGSLNETKHWLRRAHSRHLLTPDTVNRIKPLIDALAPKLNAYLRSIGPVPGQGRIDSSLERTTNN